MLILRLVLVVAASVTPGAAALALASEQGVPMRTHPSAINKVFAGADRPGRGKSIGRVAGRAEQRLVFRRWCTTAARAQNVRTGRMIRLRRVAFLLPSALSKSLDSSQSPYSAWSVRIRRAASRASRDVPRGRYTTR